MFARVLDTAKRILSRTPSIPGASSEFTEVPPTAAPSADAAMVTTRGGTETPGAATPRSSVRKQVGKRELELLDTPARAKRQRKAVSAPKKTDADHGATIMSTKESSDDTSDTITVAVQPSSSEKAVETATAENESLAIRRRSSPQVIVAKLSPPASTASASFEQPIQDDEPAIAARIVHSTQESQPSTEHIESTLKATSPSSTPKGKPPKKSSTPSSITKQSGKPRKTTISNDAHTIELTTTTTTRIIDEVPSSSYESENAPICFDEASEPTQQPSKIHKRFGSEEIIHRTVVNTQPVEHPQETNPDDSASDSDEAPEVVTTAAATSIARATQAEAQRASLAQQQKESAKRRAREELIAAQQAAKREREEKKARKLARKQAKTAAKADSDDEQAPVIQKPGTMGAGLPALLPDSLLATLPDQRAPTPPPARRGKTEEELRREKLNHHIKFLERAEKPIKDLKKGNLMVAVLGQHNKVLPPKMSKGSSDVRERWLKGRGVQKKSGKGKIGKGKMERKRFGGGGFLKGED